MAEPTPPLTGVSQSIQTWTESGCAAWQGNTTQRQAEITAVTEETNKRNATIAESNARLAVKTAEQDALQKKARVDADIAVQQRQVGGVWVRVKLRHSTRGPVAASRFCHVQARKILGCWQISCEASHARAV
jgi:hypothetical protein